MYKPAMYNSVLLCYCYGAAVSRCTKLSMLIYPQTSIYPLKSFFSMRYYFELPYFQHTSSKVHINSTYDAHSNNDKAALTAA